MLINSNIKLNLILRLSSAVELRSKQYDLCNGQLLWLRLFFKQSLEYYLFMRAKQRLKAVLTIRSKLLEYTRDWLNKQGFTEIQGPILLPGNAEKPNHFKVDFFDKTAYLSGG